MKPRIFTLFLIFLPLAVVVAATAALPGHPPGRSGEDSRVTRMDELFAPWDAPDSPGCVCAVFQDGEILAARGYGQASLEHGVALTPDSVFSVASMAKQFTAASIALLALQGKLSLDDDVRKYIPELADFGATVRIRHLIHHTSGLRDYLSLRRLAGYSSKDYLNNDRVLELLYRRQALNFPPGEQHRYSNSGYVLLAEIVKRITGQSLGDFAAENIFRPLRMLNTRFDDDVRKVIKNRVTSYGMREDGGYYRYLKNFEFTGPGNLLTTVRDLQRWDRNFHDPQIGGTALIELLHTRGELNNGKKLDYALGLINGRYRGRPTVSHSGFHAGFTAELLRFPDERFSVVLLCNLATINPEPLAEKVADLYLAEQPAAPEPPTTGASAAAGGPFVNLPEEVLQRFTGHYWSGDRSYVRRIILRQGRLFFHRAPGNETELAPLDDHRFLLLGLPRVIAVSFRSPATGGPLRMVVTGGDDQSVWHPFEPVAPSPEELKEFVGSYYSKEIDTRYELLCENGDLLIKLPRADPRSLHPVAQDVFQIAGFLTVRFQRDAAGKISGALLDFHRVTNLEFERCIHAQPYLGSSTPGYHMSACRAEIVLSVPQCRMAFERLGNSSRF